MGGVGETFIFRRLRQHLGRIRAVDRRNFIFFSTRKEEDLPGRDWWATCPRRDGFSTAFQARHQGTKAPRHQVQERTEIHQKPPSLNSAIMMSMNSKQAFSMHPILHEPKYAPLHSSSEAIRRACLPTPSVRSARAFIFITSVRTLGVA